MSDWTITGSEGLPILGDTDSPGSGARCAVLLVHGFKGYKDYGMFPVIGRALADAGIICHRFNLAHSGMTDRVETFERPDLFERDTWAFQVEDVAAVAGAVREGKIAGRGLPLVLVGHSRGGVTALLAAAWRADEIDNLAGVVTINAPGTCCSLSQDQKQELLRAGTLDSPSGRTGQTLRVGRAWLQDQLDEPARHDVPAAAARVPAPLLVMHGDADTTVDPGASATIVGAARSARRVLIEGGDHVLNTPNPARPGGDRSPQLDRTIGEIAAFCDELAAPNSR